ncbi:hypothetical protein BC936DRAFT_147200, partial [Jimgerdemannia flammicorona]
SHTRKIKRLQPLYQTPHLVFPIQPQHKQTNKQTTECSLSLSYLFSSLLSSPSPPTSAVGMAPLVPQVSVAQMSGSAAKPTITVVRALATLSTVFVVSWFSRESLTVFINGG